MNTTEPTEPAPDRHEASRAAFENGYFPIAIQRDENQWRWYTDREVQRQWEAWCRALDHAAQDEARRLREALEDIASGSATLPGYGIADAASTARAALAAQKEGEEL